jgi:hypothetical protein
MPIRLLPNYMWVAASPEQDRPYQPTVGLSNPSCCQRGENINATELVLGNPRSGASGLSGGWACCLPSLPPFSG